MAHFKGRERGKSHFQNMGIFFGGSGHGPESLCQISAYHKFFLCFNVFCRNSTGLSVLVINHACGQIAIVIQLHLDFLRRCLGQSTAVGSCVSSQAATCPYLFSREAVFTNFCKSLI